MTRLHQAMPYHAHRPCAPQRQASTRCHRSEFVDDWRAGSALPPRGNRRPVRERGHRTAEATRDVDAGSRSHAANAIFALTLLGVAGVVGAAGVASARGSTAPRVSAGPFTRIRSYGRNATPSSPIANITTLPLAHSQAISGIRALLRTRPEREAGGRVTAQCLPAAHARALGIPAAPADSDEALRTSLAAYRDDLQPVVVAMIREAVANADANTRAAFAEAEALHPRRIAFRVNPAGAIGWPPARIFTAPYGISLYLRDERGHWRAFALSLSAQASSLITPINPCGARDRAGTWCLAKTLGPVLWGDRWASVEASVSTTDDVRFLSTSAGATISPGWPSPDTTVLESPDMEEVAETLLDTLISSQSRDAPVTDGERRRSPRSVAAVAHPDAAGSRALASRLTLSGLECLAAVARTGTFQDDATALLQHFWPPSAAAAQEVPETPALSAPAPTARFAHESFSGPFGRGVQWSLPPGVYVEYRPELTQNGVKVFEIDGILYGATVARTRKHASDLRPLEVLRRELGPLGLCRISRGVGVDVDGMCLECETEREDEVSVTEQGATVAQHQALEASPMVRLRVAVYSQTFTAADGHRRFFAFGRLGEFDEQGVPHVAPDSALVDGALYTQTLSGELTYYEQATTEGPVGGRRVHLTLGSMQVSAPFGTYRDHDGILHGVVQLSHDVYYRFLLPQPDALGATEPHVRLSRRDVQHHDIQSFRAAQHHRAAAENAIVLPTISYGETRTLLQLYLWIWEHSPSPADVWRGLEDIPLTVAQARQAVGQLTAAIERRVVPARALAASEDAAASAPALAPPDIDADLLPTFNRLWAHWQHYPVQSEAFINAVARDFMSRPSPLAVWSQLPFTSDVQTTRDVLAIFEAVFPRLAGLPSGVTGTHRSARDIQDRLREVSRNANIAVAEVTLVDGTRTIYYCLSGRQRAPVPTNAPTVRFVNAGRAYLQREHNVVSQDRGGPHSPGSMLPTEPPELRLVMADADLPTYHAATDSAKSRTLDTERLILAQIYADHPAGENVVRSIVMCSRLPFCDSCAVNLAMAPYHYPDAELQFYYVSPTPRDRLSASTSTAAPTEPTRPGPARRRPREEERHVHVSL